MQNPPATTRSLSPTLPAIALFLAVFVLFLPCLRNGFINFDDPTYLLDNKNIQHGLDWQTVRWAFTTNTAANWHPLTWLVHALDWRLFHVHAKGHHIVNVFLHAASAALLFIVLRKMTGEHWRSLFVAAIFGMHPLRVESVVWASELKDVLSTLFWMLTMWAYVEWVQKTAAKKEGSRFFYFLALAFFALGLMSKPMLVTLPFALLLLDYWPLGRWARPAEIGRLAVEKIPFFVLSLVACVVTYHVQQQGGAMEGVNPGWEAKIANACLSCVRYLRKFFLPVDLAIFYPFPTAGGQSVFHVLAAAALLLALTAVAVARMRRQPYLFTGWFWYLGTLLPVIGLVQVGDQAMADRYTYVPMIGFALALTWGACDAARGWRLPAFVLPALAGAALVGCALFTIRQITFWKDSETAFRRSLAVAPVANALAHMNLGSALMAVGRTDEAISHFQQALDIRKVSPEALLEIGVALGKKGDYAGAATYLQEAVAAKPEIDRGHFILGVVLQGSHEWSQAAAQFQEAVKLNPDNSEAHMHYGYTLGKLGDEEGAAAQYQAVVRIDPGDMDARNSLGVAFCRLGRWDDAIGEFQEMLKENPALVEIRLNLAMTCESAGKPEDAIAQYREALLAEPGNDLARARLGILLKTQPAKSAP